MEEEEVFAVQEDDDDGDAHAEEDEDEWLFGLIARATLTGRATQRKTRSAVQGSFASNSLWLNTTFTQTATFSAVSLPIH